LCRGSVVQRLTHVVELNANLHRIKDKRTRGSEDLLFASTTYKLEIARGCLGNCTFCAIKLGSEKFHSFPADQILSSFKSGLRNGYKSFALVAGDIGCYGVDIKTNLPNLLEKLFAVDGDYKIILWDLSFRWFAEYCPDYLSVLKANSQKISKIVVPIESGSDKILERMNRGYKIEKVKECLLDFLRTIPDINLETQIIVGFPGETDEDFQKTMELVKEISFSKVAVFKYEDRPNTKASDMPDKVPKNIINKRATILSKEPRTVVVN
jgi:MiaB/RimO family radical SAM methylthiotransferase